MSSAGVCATAGRVLPCPPAERDGGQGTSSLLPTIPPQAGAGDPRNGTRGMDPTGNPRLCQPRLSLREMQQHLAGRALGKPCSEKQLSQLSQQVRIQKAARGWHWHKGTASLHCSLPPLHVTVRTEPPGLRSVQLCGGQTPLSPGWHRPLEMGCGNPAPRACCPMVKAVKKLSVPCKNGLSLK